MQAALAKRPDHMAVQLHLTKLGEYPPLIQTRYLVPQEMAVGTFSDKMLAALNAKLGAASTPLKRLGLVCRRVPLVDRDETLGAVRARAGGATDAPLPIFAVDPARHVPVRFTAARPDLALAQRDHVVDADATVAHLMQLVRRQVQLNAQHALYLFVQGHALPPMTALVSTVAREHVDAQGVLHVTVARENSFGCS